MQKSILFLPVIVIFGMKLHDACLRRKCQETFPVISARIEEALHDELNPALIMKDYPAYRLSRLNFVSPLTFAKEKGLLRNQLFGNSI